MRKPDSTTVGGLSEACIEAIDFPAKRELDKAVVRQLQTCRCVSKRRLRFGSGASRSIKRRRRRSRELATAAPARRSSIAPAPATEPPKPCARPEVFAQNLAAQSDAVAVVAPNILSLSHWGRLRDGELYAAQPRVNWSALLRRTFDFDVKTCTTCGGRLEVRAVVTEPESAAKILESLAGPRGPPRAA